MFTAAARIARAVSVPVTVDAESGYRLPAAELVSRLLETGAVGCDLEDTAHLRGAPRPVAEQADRLAAVGEAAGQDHVVNARIDLCEDAEDERGAAGGDRAGEGVPGGGRGLCPSDPGRARRSCSPDSSRRSTRPR
ncbi:MAG TPA: isocitrate lyase/phosphoenolpyruvate mutase family protein [Amycolatopsis sp.]|uniref:isocitrate lyase/phosphoenolpyruvate mutase family protein n=1 Tax=Amycolatopsis sp. TaxID=37632 RepID=UPI002B475335|nr:isocitrate lyase/phosphoenolpyruvate mutase family protein [Amycolatopsis sp.]HKS49257.1 isocitrate lyase/phosphoenolpyruvate mutase family protein [Amycolatopsis sp.]